MVPCSSNALGLVPLDASDLTSEMLVGWEGAEAMIVLYSGDADESLEQMSVRVFSGLRMMMCASKEDWIL